MNADELKIVIAEIGKLDSRLPPSRGVWKESFIEETYRRWAADQLMEYVSKCQKDNEDVLDYLEVFYKKMVRYSKRKPQIKAFSYARDFVRELRTAINC